MNGGQVWGNGMAKQRNKLQGPALDLLGTKNDIEMIWTSLKYLKIQASNSFPGGKFPTAIASNAFLLTALWTCLTSAGLNSSIDYTSRGAWWRRILSDRESRWLDEVDEKVDSQNAGDAGGFPKLRVAELR